jgi:hypothetical protein
MLRIFTAVIFSLVIGSAAFAQSTATNGTIEGTVKDDQGALLPGVTVTVINIATNDQRVVVSNEAGLYRAPLLSLGTYRVSAELQGFKKFEQTGITLRSGQTAVIDIQLGVGTVSETITVTADSPIVDAARIDIGHSLSDQEVHSLPLVARNPYNFALVQPGVTGIENVEFGVPRLAANGAAMRINYQIDGNTNTEKDRAGLRLLPMSEVMIQEIKVVTTGFAPEFGQTMGMVFNAVTPSGTNAFHGEGSYLFRRRPFSAFPFFFGCGSTTPAANCPDIAANAVKPETRVDTGTAALGGPIVRNKLFFYGGWEQTRRDLSSGSLITVTPSLSDSFVGFFLDRGARAVIGTECPMTVEFAHPFARHLLESLLGGATAGRALLDARRHFLNEARNPLGLAYSLYGTASASFAPPVLSPSPS